MEMPLSFLKKADADYVEYLKLWQDKPFSEILPRLSEIHHMVKLHKCLHTAGINPRPAYIEYLNRFQNPLTILLAHWEQYYWDDTEEVLANMLRDICDNAYADENGYVLDENIGTDQWYPVLCGRDTTMESYAAHGVPALNPKTMEWQVIDKDAIYFVRRDKEIDDPNAPEGKVVCATLLCDKDLHTIARNKGLIFN